MNLQGYQKLTLLDYPGKVACTVFTGGCNFRCPFCHNYEFVTSPNGYNNAYDEAFEYLKTRRGVLDGVCITGGEPLLQPDLTDFVKALKDMGFLIKLDTNGSMPDKLEALLSTGLLDYIAMDIKSSPKGYDLVTGVECDFDCVERSIRLLENCGVEHEFRTTAVKGLHTIEDFVQIAKLIKGTKRYYIQRFVSSEFVPDKKCSAFSDEEMAEILNVVSELIPEVQLRG